MVDLLTGGYATVADLAAWTSPDGLPENALRLLRSATVLVAEACQRDIYTDTPTAEQAIPLRDATCSQAAAWMASGIDPDKLGLDPASAPVKKSSILTGNVERDTTAQAKAALAAVDGLCQQATSILTVTGLLWIPVAMGDPAPILPTFGLSGPDRWSGYGTRLTGIDGYSLDAYPVPVAYVPIPVTQPAPVAPALQQVSTFTSNFTIAPGDEAWALVGPGQTITATIEPEPAGQHVRLKNLPESQGPLIAAPTNGMTIDGRPTFTLQPGDAYEFDSDGTRLSIF